MIRSRALSKMLEAPWHSQYPNCILFCDEFLTHAWMLLNPFQADHHGSGQKQADLKPIRLFEPSHFVAYKRTTCDYNALGLCWLTGVVFARQVKEGETVLF
jgi:hypothetical protein